MPDYGTIVLTLNVSDLDQMLRDSHPVFRLRLPILGAAEAMLLQELLSLKEKLSTMGNNLADFQTALTGLTAQVAANKDATAAAVAAFTGLEQHLADVENALVNAGGVPPEAIQMVNDARTALAEQKDSLAAAIGTGTPAPTPTPTPDPTPPPTPAPTA